MVTSLPACTELINQFVEFCGVAFLSGEQHVELCESRINRDISDGVTGDSSINCEQAESLEREANKENSREIIQ